MAPSKFRTQQEIDLDHAFHDRRAPVRATNEPGDAIWVAYHHWTARLGKIKNEDERTDLVMQAMAEIQRERSEIPHRMPYNAPPPEIAAEYKAMGLTAFHKNGQWYWSDLAGNLYWRTERNIDTMLEHGATEITPAPASAEWLRFY